MVLYIIEPQLETNHKERNYDQGTRIHKIQGGHYVYGQAMLVLAKCKSSCSTKLTSLMPFKISEVQTPCIHLKS